jgi:hypothetical protein
MSDAEQEPKGGPAFDPCAEARAYGAYYDIPQREGEDDFAYRSRVAGELRRQGKIVEAHEAYSGRRWDDPEQGSTGPMTGIIGGIAQALQGREYSPHDPERQIGDDIASGVVASAGESQSDAALGMLFDMLGPSGAMDVLDAFTGPDRPDESR